MFPNYHCVQVFYPDNDLSCPLQLACKIPLLKVHWYCTIVLGPVCCRIPLLMVLETSAASLLYKACLLNVYNREVEMHVQ